MANGADMRIKRSGRNNGEPGPAYTQPHAGPTCALEQNRCCLLSLGTSTKVILVWEENKLGDEGHCILSDVKRPILASM